MRAEAEPTRLGSGPFAAKDRMASRSVTTHALPDAAGTRPRLATSPFGALKEVSTGPRSAPAPSGGCGGAPAGHRSASSCSSSWAPVRWLPASTTTPAGQARPRPRATARTGKRWPMLTPPGGTRPRCRRELMSSLVNTLCRWYSTVRGLMNSWAPISGFVRPSRAMRAIWASWGVSTSRSPVRLRTVSPVATSSRRARSANPSAPDPVEAVVRGPQLFACVDAPVLATQPFPVEELGARQRGHGIRLRRSRSIASRYWRSAASPSLSSAREPASMPSAQSVPVACVRPRGDRARSAVSGAGRCGRRLDQLGERPAKSPASSCSRTCCAAASASP